MLVAVFGIGPVELLIVGGLCFAMLGALVAVLTLLLHRSQANAHLTVCPDCGRRASRLATHCPACGRPLD